MDFANVRPVLEAIDAAAAAREVLDLDRLAADLELEPFELDALIADVEGCGLASLDPEFDHAVMFKAGRQYLARRGVVDEDVLRFLPSIVDDLYARGPSCRLARSSSTSSARS